MTARGRLTTDQVDVVVVPTGHRVAPWDRPVGALPVLGGTLAESQHTAFEALGLCRVDAATSGRPALVLSDRQWVTPSALEKMLAAGPGRMRVDDAAWWQTHGPMQPVTEAGAMELALWDGTGSPPDTLADLCEISLVDVDLGLQDSERGGADNLRLAHANRPLRVGAAGVHLVACWPHLVYVNQLAIQALAHAAKARFDRASMWDKAAQLLRLLSRAGSTSPHAVATAMNVLADDVDIHPSATVEASILGPGCVVGPHAVVRASVLGAGVVVDEHATLVSSVAQDHVRVGPYGHLRYSVAMPHARISAGAGFQLSIFGEHSFVAWGAAALDLSFGRTIRADVGSGRQDSGQHLLGCAVGDRAVVGQGVRLAPGALVPSDATLFAPPDTVYRGWGDHPATSDPVHPAGRSVRRPSADAPRGLQHGLPSGRQDALLSDDAGDETGGGDVEGEVSGG